MPKVVIVDDNKEILFTTSKMLELLGYECLTYNLGSKFLQEMPEFDFLLLDMIIEQDTMKWQRCLDQAQKS